MNKQEKKILIIDDEIIALENLEHVLSKEGYIVTALQSGKEAIKNLASNSYDLVITDLKMKGVDGMKVLECTKKYHPESEVVMITGYATVRSAIEALKAGAYHYIAKPYKLDEVRLVTEEALKKVSLKQENSALKKALRKYKNMSSIITINKRMKSMIELAQKVAVSGCNIVITGESGTGKELMARYIHSQSSRSDKPLLSINCGAFSEELLVNELFGHEKDAYTGATTQKTGLIEQAAGGTLFLDEISEMSLSMQVKLLRVIQENEFMRVGGTKTIKADVRYLSATNRNLQEEVKNGRFRKDLFFRINVVPVHLPTLVDRHGDIPVLIDHFIEKYNIKMDKHVTGISPEVKDILNQYDYPGNIRELENIIEHGIALTNGEVIEISHLPEDLHGILIKTFRKNQDGRIPSLEENEQVYIQWVLEESGGNKSLAAKHLGIDRVSLWRKIKKYNL